MIQSSLLDLGLSDAIPPLKGWAILNSPFRAMQSGASLDWRGTRTENVQTPGAGGESRSPLVDLGTSLTKLLQRFSAHHCDEQPSEGRGTTGRREYSPNTFQGLYAAEGNRENEGRG